MPGRGTQGIRFSRVRFDDPALFATPVIRAQGSLAESSPQTVRAWYRNTQPPFFENPFETHSLAGVLVTQTGEEPAAIGVPEQPSLGESVYANGAVHSFKLSLELGVENSAATATLELRNSYDVAIETWENSSTDLLSYDTIVTPGLYLDARDDYFLYLSTSNVLYAARVRNIKLRAFDECIFPGKNGGDWWV